jgi:DNA mismatch endonuclease (patch repair protein)
MADTLKPHARSALMARVHGRNTTPEIIVRSMLYRLGFRYRLHARELPGRPDIVFRSRRKAIFVHGCFWHQHPGCRKATIPKTRNRYWAKKLQGNVDRDRKTLKQLKISGWDVLVLWECELSDSAWLQDELISFMSGAQGRKSKLKSSLRRPKKAR